MPLQWIQLVRLLVSAATASMMPAVQHGLCEISEGVVLRGECRQDITELPDVPWHTAAPAKGACGGHTEHRTCARQ